ncbi:hypothetical protein GQS52_02025 [Streptomyces sp. SCUT-3]|uniref:hypothetical protein n=1 Tax=Streptomyces sp. SCUT-3 TaxID=2684469 RepID=UPI000CC60FBC|nr:hypothetical protein [Streptomyces sp. SCUT-3]PLW71600.1 hypothetical protein C0036_16970 [Streptomyces sp. DJ]QMV20770.1 hypothetical protein GQS52_02025 [Streptomyces sp. SCUT-3]
MHTAGPHARTALRREAPCTVALLATEQDFAAMRRHSTFVFDDHHHYLAQTEGLLRVLAAQGTHVVLALFDPEEFTVYCADEGLDPDAPSARARYTAEVAATGPLVHYHGQPLSEIAPLLLASAHRRATWESAGALLAEAAACAHCSTREDPGASAFHRATLALARLLEAAGPGTHHLVCSVTTDGAPLTSALHIDNSRDEELRLGEADALVLTTVLAAGLATGAPGGVVMRSIRPGARDTVRGWALHDGWLRPLTEAEVFNAYCTDAATGEPVAPEPGVDHRAGIPLAPPD